MNSNHAAKVLLLMSVMSLQMSARAQGNYAKPTNTVLRATLPVTSTSSVDLNVCDLWFIRSQGGINQFSFPERSADSANFLDQADSATTSNSGSMGTRSGGSMGSAISGRINSPKPGTKPNMAPPGSIAVYAHGILLGYKPAGMSFTDFYNNKDGILGDNPLHVLEGQYINYQLGKGPNPLDGMSGF